MFNIRAHFIMAKKADNNGIIFIMIFAIVWIGDLIVSLNSQFLGVNLNIFQYICFLGYCMLAIVLTAIVNFLLGFLPSYIDVNLLVSAYSIYSQYLYI